MEVGVGAGSSHAVQDGFMVVICFCDARYYKCKCKCKCEILRIMRSFEMRRVHVNVDEVIRFR
jgi:hypothetical protein